MFTTFREFGMILIFSTLSYFIFQEERDKNKIPFLIVFPKNVLHIHLERERFFKASKTVEHGVKQNLLAKAPSRSKRSQKCTKIFRQLQVPKRSRQVIAECEFLDVVQIVPRPDLHQFFELDSQKCLKNTMKTLLIKLFFPFQQYSNKQQNGEQSQRNIYSI